MKKLLILATVAIIALSGCSESGSDSASPSFNDNGDRIVFYNKTGTHIKEIYYGDATHGFRINETADQVVITIQDIWSTLNVKVRTPDNLNVEVITTNNVGQSEIACRQFTNPDNANQLYFNLPLTTPLLSKFDNDCDVYLWIDGVQVDRVRMSDFE